MRPMLFFMLCSFCAYTQPTERHDSLPAIKSSFTQSFKVRQSGDEIEKLESNWYLFFRKDAYVEYDMNNQSTTLIEYEDGQTEDITYFEHDENKNLKSITKYVINKEGDTILDYFTRYYYDQKEFCYVDSCFKADSSLNFWTRSAFDYNKNISVSKTLYADGSFHSMYIEYLDNNDELIKTEHYYKLNRIETTTYFEKDTAQRMRGHYSIEEEDTSSYSYTQSNELGLPILEVFYYPTKYSGEMKYTFDYEFNVYGDWIIQFVYSEGKLEYMVEREITYWD